MSSSVADTIHKDMMHKEEEVDTMSTTTDMMPDTVSTTDKVDSIQFPDDDDEDETMQWRDVPRHTWLCITRTRDVTINDQVIKILTLLHRDRTTRSAWTTGIITRAIDDFLTEHAAIAAARDDPTQKLYIKSLGKTNSKSNPTFTYYNFKLKLF